MEDVKYFFGTVILGSVNDDIVRESDTLFYFLCTVREERDAKKKTRKNLINDCHRCDAKYNHIINTFGATPF